MNEQADLEQLMETFLNDDSDIKQVSLCTADGFDIAHKGNGEIVVESDKLSAMSSTFCSMSQSVSELLLGKESEISSIETTDGHILFISTNYRASSCVLTVAAKGNISLGEARYKTKRLSNRIESVQ